MLRHLLLISFGLLVGGSAIAQQRPQYSQYMMNNYILNPAVTGIEDFTDGKLGMRRQWVGLDGAPVSYYASVHTALGKKERIVQSPFSLFKRGNKKSGRRQFQKPDASRTSSRFHKVSPHHGVGGIVELDKTGPLSTRGIHLSYAYHQPLTQSLRLSLGLASGFRQFGLNRSELNLADDIDEGVAEHDVRNNSFDLSAGAWLYAKNFYVGLSGQQLLQNQIDFTGGGFNGGGKLQAHYFATAGARLEASDRFALVPSVMVKIAQPSPPSFDINAKGIYANTVWAGLSYRHNDAMALMAGAYVTPQLSLGYSYDFTTSELSRVSAGSHEIVLGLRLGSDLVQQSALPWW